MHKTPAEGFAHMRGQLESLEVLYGEITERDLVTSRPDENSNGVYRFDDGAEARTLPQAVEQGHALTRFAVNQLKQSAG